MPIHDWTRVTAGGFHNFHQDWTIELYRTLNRGLLPVGYSAYTDMNVDGPEPDVIAVRSGDPAASGGLAVADMPPKLRRAARFESEAAGYARRANRIIVRNEFGPVVAAIEIISPGNKDSRHAVRAFRTKAVNFLRAGVNLLFVDLFPPTPRDPDGLHALIWHELTDQSPPTPERPLAVAAYDAGDGLTAYVEPLAVGDLLPDGPLFLSPGWYVNVPFETTYMTTWNGTPAPIRDRVEPPA